MDALQYLSFTANVALPISHFLLPAGFSYVVDSVSERQRVEVALNNKAFTSALYSNCQ